MNYPFVRVNFVGEASRKHSVQLDEDEHFKQ